MTSKYRMTASQQVKDSMAPLPRMLLKDRIQFSKCPGASVSRVLAWGPQETDKQGPPKASLQAHGTSITQMPPLTAAGPAPYVPQTANGHGA